MSIIIYALGVITGLLVAFMIELFTRKPSERNQPISTYIKSKEKGIIIENNPIYDSLMNYDTSRDTEDTFI